MRERDSTADAELVRRILSGDASASEELVRTYWEELFRAAYLLLRDQAIAEDVTQEALLQALRRIDRFEPGRPLRPWMRRIAVNRAIDHLRNRSARPETSVSPAAIDGLAPESLEGEIAHLALSGQITDALLELSEQLRVAVVLRYLFDYQPAEIAELTATQPGTVRTHIHRGLNQLRDHLEAQIGESHERSR